MTSRTKCQCVDTWNRIGVNEGWCEGKREREWMHVCSILVGVKGEKEDRETPLNSYTHVKRACVSIKGGGQGDEKT